MNEQIKNFAAQAGFVLWENEEYRPPNVVVDWSSVYDDELVKFAELIVRECAAVALREDHEPHECILNHFGVKEDMTETNEWEITLEEAIKKGTKAWAGVDATEWVDELRGDDDEPNTPSTVISKREWVNLTDEDIAEVRRNGAHSVSDIDFRAIEAKIKDKNHD